VYEGQFVVNLMSIKGLFQFADNAFKFDALFECFDRNSKKFKGKMLYKVVFRSVTDDAVF
jgi:hypothetical protein